MITEGNVVKLKPEALNMIGGIADRLVFPCIVVNVYTTSSGERVAQCLTRYKKRHKQYLPSSQLERRLPGEH